MPRSGLATNAAKSDEDPKTADIVVKLDKFIREDSSIQLREAVYNVDIEDSVTGTGISPADDVTVNIGPYNYYSRIHYILRPTSIKNMIISYYTEDGMFEGGVVERGRIWLNLTGVSTSINIDYDGSVYNASQYLYYTGAPMPQKLGTRTIVVRDDFKRILLWNYGLIMEDESYQLIRAIKLDPADTETYSAINIEDVATDGNYIYLLATLLTYGPTRYTMLMKFDLDMNLIWSYRYHDAQAAYISILNNKIYVTDYYGMLLEINPDGVVSKVITYDVEVGGVPRSVQGIKVLGGTDCVYLVGSLVGSPVVMKTQAGDLGSLIKAVEYSNDIEVSDATVSIGMFDVLILVGTSYSANAPNGEDAFIGWVSGVSLEPLKINVYGFDDISHLTSVITIRPYMHAIAVGDSTEQVGASYVTGRLLIVDDSSLFSPSDPQIIDDTSSVTTTDITSDVTVTVITNHGINNVPVEVEITTPNLVKEDITDSILTHVYIPPESGGGGDGH